MDREQGSRSGKEGFVCVVLVDQLCLTLCDPTRLSVHGVFQVRQEHWSGLTFLSPGSLPDRGIEPGSPTLQSDSLLSEAPGILETFLG